MFVNALSVPVAITLLAPAFAQDAPLFTMTRREIDVALVVRDMTASIAYYKDQLKLEQVSETPYTTSDGGKMLIFHHGDAGVKLVVHDPVPPAYDGEPNAAIGFRWIEIYRRNMGDVLPDMPQRDPDGNAVILRNPETQDPELASNLGVGLVVRDLDKSAAFYGKTLELPEVAWKNANERAFVAGKSRIILRQAPSPETPLRDGVRKTAIGFRFITFFVEDGIALHKAFEERGVTITRAPAPSTPGGRTLLMFITDPDGNWIEFASPAPRQD